MSTFSRMVLKINEMKLSHLFLLEMLFYTGNSTLVRTFIITPEVCLTLRSITSTRIHFGRMLMSNVSVI